MLNVLYILEAQRHNDIIWQDFYLDEPKRI